MGLASFPARSNKTSPLCLDDIANNYRLSFSGGGGRGGVSSEFPCCVSRRLFLLYERSLRTIKTGDYPNQDLEYRTCKNGNADNFS